MRTQHRRILFNEKKKLTCAFLYSCCYDTDFTLVNTARFLSRNWENPFDGLSAWECDIYCFITLWENTVTSSEIFTGTEWHVTTSCWLWFTIPKPSASYLKQAELHTIRQNEKEEEIFVLFFNIGLQKRRGLWSPGVSLKTTTVDGWLTGEHGRTKTRTSAAHDEEKHDIIVQVLFQWDPLFLILLKFDVTVQIRINFPILKVFS